MGTVMRFDIRYHMRFRYDSPVREAHNEIRVRPADLPQQRLLAHRLTTDPSARVLSFVDYFGTTVQHVGHVLEHDHLEIIAEAAVETRERSDAGNAPIGAIGADSFSLKHAEYLRPSPHVEWTDDIADLARASIVGCTDVRSAVDSVVASVRSNLTYRRGVTQIGTGLVDLLDIGGGVCQDFTHLTIGMLRALGVPARYVSGYLFAADETDLESGDDPHVVVQTHAWVEAAIPGGDWFGVDPTNHHPVGDRHVTIGFGRDYDDVAPVRGVYLGDATPEVDATVEIRRMEPMAKVLSDRPSRRRPVSRPMAPPMIEHHTGQQQQ